MTEWQDQSGNGRHASQSARDRQPAPVDGALNDLPVIRFDGSDDGLTLGDLSAAFPSAAMLFVVATINDVSCNSIIFSRDFAVVEQRMSRSSGCHSFAERWKAVTALSER